MGNMVNAPPAAPYVGPWPSNRKKNEEQQRQQRHAYVGLEVCEREQERQRSRELECQAREREEERQRALERQAREREEERQKHLARQKELEQQRERERKRMEDMKRREQEAKEEAARQEAIRREEDRRMKELRKLEESRKKKQEQFEYRLSQTKGISQKFISWSLENEHKKVHETVHIESHNPFKFSSKPLPDAKMTTSGINEATKLSNEETSPEEWSEDSDTEITESDETLSEDEEFKFTAKPSLAGFEMTTSGSDEDSDEETCPEVDESGSEFSDNSDAELAKSDETSSEDEGEKSEDEDSEGESSEDEGSEDEDSEDESSEDEASQDEVSEGGEHEAEGSGLEVERLTPVITVEMASRVSLVILRAESDEELDREWLMSAQVMLLIFYAQQNGFSDLQTDILIEFLAQVQSDLSNEESLSLAKTVSSLGDIHPSAYPIPLDSNIPLQCKLAGLLIHCGNIYQNTDKWMQRCLLAFLPAVTEDNQLQHIIIEASSTIWSSHDWFQFLNTFNSRQLSTSVLKHIVHFIQTYRIQPEVIEAALAEDNVTNFLKEEVKSEMNKPLCDIMDEMRETELVDEAVLDQVEKIVRATVAMIDKRNINITLNYKSHLSDMTNVNHAKGIFRKLQHSDICYDELADAIITLMCAVQKVQGFHPRETQLVAFAILLLSSTTSTGRLLQMLTGEGKSCVIAMFAAALGLQSKQVDIVTSSPVLAVRDAEKWGEFFSIFDLKATHNTNIKKQLSNEEKTHCYQLPIVYGTVSKFSADILWQEFEQKQVRSNRRFDAVIVDEVDLLMLDEGVRFTYLSHNAAVLLHIEPVLATIWAIVGPFKAVATSSGSILYAGRPAPFTDIIFRCLDPQTSEMQDPSDLLAIARELNIIPDIPDDLSSADEETKRKVLSSILSSVVPADALVLIRELDNYMDPPPMLQAYMANDAGLLEAVHTLSKDEGVVTKMILLLENGLACFLESQEDLRDEAIVKVKETLNFSDSASNDDKSQEDQIKLPSFLKKFVTDQIPTYVTNAIRALEMLENREYAISEDGRIIPVDYLNSGVMELNKKWGGGLQQMLEMKHGLCLSPLSLVTNFMSNIEFFSRYAQGNGCIYGLSGTLGLDTTTTTQVLRDLYEVQACSIPTHKVRKLYEKPTIIVQGGQEEWFERIVDALKEAVPSKEDGGDCLWKKRAVLILCEDIKTASSLRDFLLKGKKWEEKKVLLYAHSNSEEHSAINKSLEPGDIIIATNLAGRGTDIKVCEEVDHSGGLLCLLTFLPRNRRVELQAFGRTGRKGKPGSVQCILKASTLPLHCQELEISAIRQIREEEEALRLDQLVHTDVREVQLKEKLFKSYCQFLRGLHRDFETHASLSEELAVVVSSLNENWGQWLLMKAPQIERLEEEVLQQELCQACELWRPFILPKLTGILHLPVTNFYHMIKFGNQLLIKHDKKNAEKACSYFTESIDLEKRYALIAYYNHAYCTIVAAKKGYKDKAKQDLEAAKTCIDPYIFEVTSVLQLISVTNQARGTVSTPTRVKKEAGDFISQMQARVQILGFLKEKINEALEKIKQLGDDDIEVKPVGTFSLIPEPDRVTNKELALMWNLGLEVVYSVQKKPTFCYGGLICFCLGAAQILAGSLLTVCTVGTAASIGMALISEGISDCITGAVAMATGEFSWKEYAIDKATSLAISLVSGGVASLAKHGAKALKIGHKIGKEARRLKAVPEISKHAFGVATKATRTAVVKHVTKEIVTEVVLYAGNKLYDHLVEKTLKRIGDRCRKNIMTDLDRAFAGGKMGNLIDHAFLDDLEESFIKDDKVPLLMRKHANDFFSRASDVVTRRLASTSELKERLASASSSLFGQIANATKKSNSKVAFAARTAEICISGAVILDTVTQLDGFVSQFIPETERVCEEFLKRDGISVTYGKESKYSQMSSAVKLKTDLAEHVAKLFGEAVSLLLQQRLGSVASHAFNQSVGHLGRKLLSDHVLKTDRKLEKIQGARYANEIAYVPPDKRTSARKSAHPSVSWFAEHVSQPDHPGSLLEARIAAEHFGQGVTIYQDIHGKLVTTHSIKPSTKKSDSTIQLVYTPPSGAGPNSVGHYDVLVPGKGRVTVQADKGNCLYHAFACSQNPSLSHIELRKHAETIRQVVVKRVTDHPHMWSDHIKRREQLSQMRKGIHFALVGAGKKNKSKSKKKPKKTAKNEKAKVKEGLYHEKYFGKHLITMYWGLQNLCTTKSKKLKPSSID